MKRLVVAGLISLFMTGTVYGHGEETHDAGTAEPPEMVETHFGKTGDPNSVDRIIEVGMSDELTFTPSEITVNAGQTIRFVVRNEGEVMHEMVIGSAAELIKHSNLMEEFPEMEHEEPFMAHVGPGKSGEIVWTFSHAGTFEFGCLIPGHFDGGMKGTIVVK